jgi:CsoR family transcriptional regulator, copper-sensing transcriptional repressor
MAQGKANILTDNVNIKKDNIINRLNRIEGQIKGIRKMVENNICCNEVLVQVMAARAAISRVGIKMLEVHSEDCIKDLNNSEDKEKVLVDLLDTLEGFMKL